MGVPEGYAEVEEARGGGGFFGGLRVVVVVGDNGDGGRLDGVAR